MLKFGACATLLVIFSMTAGVELRAAPVNFLTMTEYASNLLKVQATFPEVVAPNPANTVPAFNFSGNVTFPGNDTWTFGNLSLLLPSDTYDGILNKVQF